MVLAATRHQHRYDVCAAVWRVCGGGTWQRATDPQPETEHITKKKNDSHYFEQQRKKV